MIKPNGMAVSMHNLYLQTVIDLSENEESSPREGVSASRSFPSYQTSSGYLGNLDAFHILGMFL